MSIMFSNKKIETKDVFYIALTIVVILLFLSIHLYNLSLTKVKDKTAEKIKGVYEMLTERDVEILNIEDKGNLYKILLRLKLDTGDVLKEVYLTKDGLFFSEDMLNISEFTQNLERQKNFTECLRSNGVIVFGQKNEPNTARQLLIIGNYANKIFVDCSGTNIDMCKKLGIKRIPTVIYKNMNYTGVKPIRWFEALTGCKY